MRLNRAGRTISALQLGGRTSVARQNHTRRTLGWSQAGDTIVEVLIAMSVISLVLVGAYVSTNRNTASTQDAQERSQATKLAQTQLESLRLNYYTGTINGNHFTFTNGDCYVAGSESASGCTTTDDGPNYTQTIITPGSAIPAGASCALPAVMPSTSYTVCVYWDSLVGNNSKDNVTMYYQP